jgi:hypothetical protein
MQRAYTIYIIFRESIGRATTIFLILNIALVHCQSKQSFKQQLATLKKLMMTPSTQTIGSLIAVYY